MSNALSEERKQQVIALGKLGWPLRRIEQASGVRRETAGAFLKAAGIVVRLPRFWGRRIPAKPASNKALGKKYRAMSRAKAISSRTSMIYVFTMTVVEWLRMKL